MPEQNNKIQVLSPIGEQTITSLEIAEITGKMHNDVLKAIRAMEPAWENVTQGKFSLSEYKDSTGRTLPCYILTKTECLYVATKFNDEARAKLVIRWEMLKQQRFANLPDFSNPAAAARAWADEVDAKRAALQQLKDAQERNKLLEPKAAWTDQKKEKTPSKCRFCSRYGTLQMLKKYNE